MKIILSLLTLFVSVIILSSLPSCTKNTTTTISKTDTVIVTDTVTGTSLTKTQILASHTWEVEEAYNDISGTVYYYQRDSATSAINLSGIRYTFNTNGTGTYVDGSGNTYNTTWQFTTSDDANMQINFIGLSSNPTDNWTMISITDSVFLQSTYVPSLGLVVTAELVPVP
jgi:hypothetical protein